MMTLVLQSANAQQASSSQSSRVVDSAAVVATVARFHGALASGDSVAATALLTEDALIVETGEIETKDEYVRHHLGADIAWRISTIHWSSRRAR